MLAQPIDGGSYIGGFFSDVQIQHIDCWLRSLFVKVGVSADFDIEVVAKVNREASCPFFGNHTSDLTPVIDQIKVDALLIRLIDSVDSAASLEEML